MKAFLVAFLLCPVAAYAQTGGLNLQAPSINPNAPKIDASTLNAAINAQLATKQDLNGDSSGQHVMPFGGSNAYTTAILSTQLTLVPDWYKQTTDGTDDAPSIQRAINASCAIGGGRVDLLSRHYSIQSPISIPCAIIMQGRGWQEPNQSATSGGGTWLDVTSPSFSAITISGVPAEGTEIRDIAFDQPNQTPPTSTGTWTPVVYAPVINVVGVGGKTRLSNTMFWGVYDGVAFTNGGRFIADHLYGQFFHAGLTGSLQLDSIRLDQIHIFPYWSYQAPVIAWQQVNAIGIVLGRVDTPFIDNVFVFGAADGIQFRTDASSGGVPGGVSTGFEIGKLSCDSVVNCVDIEGAGVNGHIGQIRQAGQQGTSSGAPYTDATVIRVVGQANIQVGLMSALLIDKTAISDISTTVCSSIQVGESSFDYTLSAQPAVYLFTQAYGGCQSRVDFGIKPLLILGGKTLTASNGTGAATFWPTAVQQ